MIAGLYGAIFTIFALYLTFNVIQTRRKERIGFGSGGSEVLARKRSAHSNFMETTPLFIVLLLLIELQEILPAYGLHILGGSFLIARIIHAVGVLRAPGYGVNRTIGMLAIMVLLLIASGILVYVFYLGL